MRRPALPLAAAFLGVAPVCLVPSPTAARPEDAVEEPHAPELLPEAPAASDHLEAGRVAFEAHDLVPFRAGAWLELPLGPWFALHVGMDVGLGPYVARDDAIFGLLVEAGGGVTFVLGAGGGEGKPEREAGRRPGRRGPPDDLGRDGP